MTPHKEALAAPASEPAPGDSAPTFSQLNLSGGDIFDVAKVFGTIRKKGGPDATEIRKAAVTELKATIEQAINEQPRASREAVEAYCWLTDRVVETVYRVGCELLHPNPNPTEGERLAILAVGGYGRGEMAPYSDVDLLFLMPWKVTPWAESLIESMLYIFWD